MGQFAIRLLTLVLYVTTLVVIPMVMPAVAEISSKPAKKHKRKIQRSLGFSDSWSGGRAPPVIRPPSRAGQVCPGLGRGYECGTWPPPMDEDTDGGRTGLTGCAGADAIGTRRRRRTINAKDIEPIFSQQSPACYDFVKFRNFDGLWDLVPDECFPAARHRCFFRD